MSNGGYMESHICKECPVKPDMCKICTERVGKPADQRKLTILFRDGHKISWSPGEYTGYAYKGKIFVVTNGEQWIGVANMDTVEYITVM